jgi:hypothetical protein
LLPNELKKDNYSTNITITPELLDNLSQ